jgi:hypothetical protein
MLAFHWEQDAIRARTGETTHGKTDNYIVGSRYNGPNSLFRRRKLAARALWPDPANAAKTVVLELLFQLPLIRHLAAFTVTGPIWRL